MFDFYEAAGDTSARRPLIVWMHGGGFKFGSKRSKGIRIWSNAFAKRGYVCAAINYPLSKKNTLRNFNALIKACADAVQNMSEVIQYFNTHASEFRIDTGRIILAGNSAGAIIALQTAYASSGDLQKKIADRDRMVNPTVLVKKNIAAVINFWGAVFDTSWLNNSSIPIVSVHGRKDNIVPYKNNGSSLFGSWIIHQKAQELGIQNRLKTYDRFGHELQKHFIPILRSGATKRRWRESGNFAAEFLYEYLFR